MSILVIKRKSIVTYPFPFQPWPKNATIREEGDTTKVKGVGYPPEYLRPSPFLRLNIVTSSAKKALKTINVFGT